MNENNLNLYNKVRKVPDTAKKPIQGGRLKGMTDINPMWRIKVLTEQFGPCGLGWYYNITDKRIELGSNDEKVAFVDIDLFVKYGDEWSKPIQGTGGSSFIAKERNGLYTSDECFKMSLTDALGVAMKALGVAADVYFERDRSKYDIPTSEPQGKPQGNPQERPPTMDKEIVDASLASDKQLNFLYKLVEEKKYTPESMASYIKHHYNKDSSKELTKKEASEVIKMLQELGK